MQPDLQLNVQSEELANAPDRDADALARLDELRRWDREFAVARIAAVIAHAVGTPLNVIVGRAGLIRSSPGATAAILNEVECIERKVEQLAQKLRAVVDFYAGTHPASSSCGLDDVVTEAVSLYVPIARAKGLTLRVVASTVPAAILERTLGNVILANLLSLAIGEAAPRTSIELDTGYSKDDVPLAGGWLWLALRFTGGKLPLPKPIERLEFPPNLEPRATHQHQVLMMVSSMLRSAGGRLEILADETDATLLKAYLPARPPSNAVQLSRSGRS
ncbi:MAG TPA: hypothetical protein VIV60_07580 [Polyangiaceae bacterium]